MGPARPQRQKENGGFLKPREFIRTHRVGAGLGEAHAKGLGHEGPGVGLGAKQLETASLVLLGAEKRRGELVVIRPGAALTHSVEG